MSRIWKGRNRKYACLFLIFFFLLCSLFSFESYNCTLVFAEEGDLNTEEKLNESIVEQLENLDLEELQNYIDELGNFSSKSIAERLLDYVKGEEVDYEDWISGFLRVVFESAIELIPVFACIVAISLLSGLITMLNSGEGRASTDALALILYFATLIPLLSVLSECIQRTEQGVLEMQKQMQIIFPIMLTLMAASGSSASVAICRPAVAFFSTNIVSVICAVVFPITVTTIVFSILSCINKDLKINRFGVFFKSINKWVIGICVSIFGIFFTLQGITAAGYDGISRRLAKYAIGNGIPIVGGFLSGGFDLVVAGSLLIKNALGNMSLFLLLSVLFEPLVFLISINVALRFTSALTQHFGAGKISDFLEETAGNMHYCTAGLLITAFLYFLSVLMMVCLSEGLL